MMIKREDGFSLVELIITMAVFVLVIAAASQVFTGLLTQFKQQSKIAETNIEGVVGLEILRQDIEHAGYGLLWNVEIDNAESPPDGNDWEQLTGYYEAASAGSPNPASFNDGNASSGTNGNPPRAILSGNNTGLNSSDYLVIKAVNVARNMTAQKWTHLKIGNVPTTWTPDCENVNKEADCTTNNTVRVIVISPGSTDANSRSLVVSGGAFFTQYNNTSGFAPTDATETRIMYGVDRDTNLRMPFNRADYYISNSDVPQRCALNTGVLIKTVISHSDGIRRDPMPLLDCVADMQVVYQRDTNGDGTIDNTTDDISALTAQQIRDQVKEVRVYILAHEGQKDPNYTHTTTTVYVGDPSIGSGHNFNIGTNVNYRWKLYTIVVTPNNLR